MIRHDRTPVGIEKLAAWPCALSLDLAELARARGDDPRRPAEELLVRERSLNPLWEDPVTMAVNAALRLLDDDDRARIELVVVGTESSPDFGKPVATYVQRFCGVQPNCRTFETKHACYGGTSALMMAAHWVASGVRPGKKALVVTTDQSRMHLGKEWEYVLGAGAVAMLVGDEPGVLELELERNGYWTAEIADTYRPTATTEVGNADESLYCYLDGLEGAYADFVAKAGELDFEREFAGNVYHTPFGGITRQAHGALLRRGRRVKRRELLADFEARALPALRYTSRCGGTYTSSTFLGLMGLIDGRPDLEPGSRVSVFAYGSGSCAEFYCARIGPEARARVAAAGLEAQLDARQPISVETYEALETARTDLAERSDYTLDTRGLDGLYERVYAGSGRLVLKGVHGYRRDYELARD